MSAIEEMVREQMERRGVRDPRVLQAMREVPREMFVPEPLRAMAYDDSALPLDHGQTISQPYMVAAMTEALALEPGDRVLEIGTGCGYQAAVLGRLVTEVFSVEIIPEMANEAAARLERLGYLNVRVRCGDGHAGWPEMAPYDAVMVTCAPEEVPTALVEQVREGGRMVIPVGGRGAQDLLLLVKRAGVMERTKMMQVRFVPMTGAEADE